MLLNIETKVGLFVIIIISLLIIGLMWLNGSNFIDRGYLIEAEFEHVGGLRPGAPVQMSGVDIGRVSNVSLTPTGAVLVSLKLKSGVTLNTDSTLFINTAGILGEKMIEVVPGEGKQTINPGTRLQGVEPFSTENFLQESLDLLTSVKKVTDSLDGLLSDPELHERLIRTTSDLETISKNLAVFSTELTSLNLPSITANLEDITNSLAQIEYTEANTFLTQINKFVVDLNSFQTELHLFLTELRANGQTANTIKEILAELEPTAANLNELSSQLTNGSPSLPDLLLETQKMLQSINSITEGVNNLIKETANKESTDQFKSSLEKAGRVLNLADEFFETYDRLSLSNQVSFSTTQEDWGLNYQAKLSWGTRQFSLFSCEDVGDQNLFSLQFGTGYQLWQLRLGILHNWLGLGLNYNLQNFSLQADLWQPNQPVLDFYAKYQLSPFHLSLGLLDLSSLSRQWQLGVGWNF